MFPRHRSSALRPLPRLLCILAIPALSALSAFPAGTAHAQSQTADQAAAEILFQEGIHLLEENNFAAACPKLEESVRLERAPGALLNLAACYEGLGKTASAWALFIEAGTAIRRRADKDPRADVAQSRADALAVKLSKLTIEVPAQLRVAGLLVKRNGAEVGQPQWGTAVPVDPGVTLVEATAPGKQPWKKEISVPAGPGTTIVRLDALLEAPAASPGSPSPAADTSMPTQKKIAIATAGLGVAALALGAVTGGLALSSKTSMDAQCTPTDPPGCNPTGFALANDVKTFGTVSTIGFIAGGVLAAGGAILWLTAPRAETTQPKPTARTPIQLGISSSGFMVKGKW